MAEYIPNQPVIFDEVADSCLCNAIIYKQLVNFGDVTQAQFRLSPCADAIQIIDEPNFESTGTWSLDPNWSINTGQLCREGSGTDSAFQTTTATQPGMYQLTLDVDTINGEFEVFIGGQSVGFVSTIGIHIFYINLTATGLIQVAFTPVNDGDEICMNSALMYEILTNFRVSLWDVDGTFIDSFDGSTGGIFFAEDTVTFQIDWSGFGINTRGCYYFCVHDPCINTNGQNFELIINQTFPDLTNWTLATFGASTNFLNPNNEVLTYNSNTATASGTAEPTLLYPLVADICYNASFEVTLFSGSSGIPPDDARVRFTCGAYVGAWRDSLGTYTEQFTYTGGSVIFEFESVVGDATHSIAIDNVSLKVCGESLVCNYQSNDFLIGSHPCTNLINACNNEPGMGFNFEFFSPRIRLYSKLVNATYVNTRESFEDSSGKKRVLYFSRRKLKEFRVEMVPEYVHDFLSMLSGFDHVYISTTEYFVEDDEYSPVYQNSEDDMAQVTINLSIKTQDVKNINCGADDTTCKIGGECLTDPSGVEVTDPATGLCVTIP